MENRHLYRAKRINNGRWVYGLPSYDKDGEIREIEAYEDTDVEFYAVDPSTICQCTAMPDKNSKLIFEFQKRQQIKSNNERHLMKKLRSGVGKTLTQMV